MEPDLERCSGCGHVLGSGLFCTECGRPTGDLEDWRTGTAERPAIGPVPPLTDLAEPPVEPPAAPPASLPAAPDPAVPLIARLPPPAVAPPPPARYPLFADDADPAPTPDPEPEPEPDTDVAGVLVPGIGVVAEPEQVDPDPVTPFAAGAARAGSRSTSHRLPWLVGVAALVLVAMVGTLLLLPDGEDDAGTATDPASVGSPETASEPPASAPATPDSPAPPSPSRTAEPQGEAAPVTRSVSATVPAVAPANQDVDGNQVRYEARNMLDDVPATCWRMPGSGAGQEIVLDLAAVTVVSEVGLINGYAKTAGDFDWYRGNRRLLAVEWVFDDGTAVPQQLTETRDLQTVEVPGIATKQIRLRMLEVSEPGRGRSARDFTAISDLSVVGVEQG
ncbi:NADase-type glycan-binding domain-containing protein [Nocardioides nanhaiensis]|uniref:NAD glycohydrolase translocation F5/8 type C domain-containing protein n=1 Tax=Nocardioides nanhaiensis TaxID=1476871 RepID=A0ABP8WVB2_9ACTN